jgi:hypothetical protein
VPADGSVRRLARVDGWSGLGLVFVLGVVAYWIEAVAWPLQRGRDSWDYWLYWLQLRDAHPPLSNVMVFRTPLAPIVTGLPMSVGGGNLLEAVTSIIYAATVAGWAWAVRPFGRMASLVVAVVVLVLQLPFAVLFHEVSSDFVFGALLPLWAGLAVRAALRPSVGIVVGLGLSAAALTLARPAGQVIIVATLLAAPLAAGPARIRAARFAIVLAAAVLPLAAWAGYNSLRYDDFTVARGGKAWVPFFKVFGEGRIDPANGAASRRLADVVRRDVLTLPAFRRLHVTTRTYFRAPSNFETIRLLALSDREFGRSSNYSVLFDAAGEAIRKHPSWYAHSVARTYWDYISSRFALEPVRRGVPIPPGPRVLTVDGKPMRSPEALSPLVQAARFGFVWCPTDAIDRCIFKHPAVAFPLGRDQRRYVELTNRVRDWNAQLPLRNGNSTLASKLDTLSWRTPRSILWIILALVAIAIRRPRGSGVLLVLLFGAGLVLLVHALSQGPQTEFELPFAPLFAAVAIAALAMPRRHRATVSDA